MTRDYPEYLARGVTNSDCLTDGQMKHCVYQFTENTDKSLYELSIQWLDNPESEKIAKDMANTNRGSPKFILGFAVMSVKALDEIKMINDYKGMDYCRVPNRSETMWNPYHGHITVPCEMKKIKRRQLAAELVLRSDHYKYDEKLPVSNLPKHN